MIELMTTLYQQINNAHDYATYQGQAPQDATYPYVVYKLLPVESTEKDRDDYTLEVSCWDKSESTSHVKVVVLADMIRKELLHFRVVDEKQLIVVSRPNLGYVPDPNEQIKRYDITATIMTYRR